MNVNIANVGLDGKRFDERGKREKEGGRDLLVTCLSYYDEG